MFNPNFNDNGFVFVYQKLLRAIMLPF